MARTEGHGNPKWAREETILALNLYLECNGKLPSTTDRRVLELSDLLRRLSRHETESKRESFRNPAGVVFKLQNIRKVDTGKGLSNVSSMDRQVWEELGDQPEKVKRLAEVIQTGIQILERTQADEDEEVFAEGRFLTKAHRRRERNPLLKKRLLENRRRRGSLSCDLCSRKTWSSDLALNEAMFEGHHIIPLATSTGTKTKISDMALLCANCHRILHKAIYRERRWIGIEEARKILLLNPEMENYAEERRKMYSGLELDDLVAEIKRRRTKD